MNIIFLTMSRIFGITQRGIYTDLMRKFRDEGHSVFIVTPNERSLGRPTEMIEKDGVHILGVKTLNLQKTNSIEKGLGQVLVEYQFKRAIKQYMSGVEFDLIIYSTPPITFPRVISYLKHNNTGAKSYLLLKDIFPQNAIDLGMMSKSGIKGILYNYFRKKEKKLYALSDFIGCMSPANVDYVLKHNPELTPNKVEVAPNSIELVDKQGADKVAIRQKYGLPATIPIFIYGGNLGRPQGIPFLLECLSFNAKRTDCHFVIIGNGTELSKVKKWYSVTNPSSVTLMEHLPKTEYDNLVASCDVGLIFLDHRFTIPNFPSRLLPYLENKMPILAATDRNSDTGKLAEENGYGYWCESDSVAAFTAILDKMIHSDRQAMGEKGFAFLRKNYQVQKTYDTIMRHCL